MMMRTLPTNLRRTENPLGRDTFSNLRESAWQR